jgi:hypothetical protein
MSFGEGQSIGSTRVQTLARTINGQPNFTYLSAKLRITEGPFIKNRMVKTRDKTYIWIKELDI